MLRLQGIIMYKLLIVCQCIYMIVCASQFRITERTKCRPSKNILKRIIKVSITECVQECRARQRCAFLNYRRRTLLCELYTDDGAVEAFITNSVATGPCVYVHRDDIQNANTGDPCGCSDSETCNVDTLECSVTECESPTDLGLLTTQGNMNDVGSRRTYTCGPAGFSYNVTECMNTGLWNPLLLKCTFSYQGCYEDIGARTLRGRSTGDSQMTVEMCSERCYGYTYIGLQFYSQCFCGNILYHNVPKAEADCNTPCKGNSSQMCGGSWRNSLYKLTML